MTEQLHFHFSLSCIGGGNGNPPQRSCLENPRDGGAWWAAVYGVAQSRTRLKQLSSSSSSSIGYCSPPGYMFMGSPGKILECVAIPLSMDLFDIGIKPTFLMSPALAGGFFTTSATWKAQLQKGQHQKKKDNLLDYSRWKIESIKKVSPTDTCDGKFRKLKPTI